MVLPIGICLLAEGVRLEKRRNIERLSCYRYEAMRIWWRYKFGRSLLYGIASAAALGFDAPMGNSLDGVSDRDYALELLGDLSILMTHLSRMAEEVVMSVWPLS